MTNTLQSDNQKLFFEVYSLFKKLEKNFEAVTETQRLIFKELSRLKALLTEEEYKEVISFYTWKNN